MRHTSSFCRLALHHHFRVFYFLHHQFLALKGEEGVGAQLLVRAAAGLEGSVAALRYFLFVRNLFAQRGNVLWNRQLASGHLGKISNKNSTARKEEKER